MSKPTQVGSKSKIAQSEQEMGNQSFDSLFGINVIEALQYIPAGDGVSAQLVRPLSSAIALRLDDSTTANVTYVGRAHPGADPADAVWQINKMDETGGLTITWCDGNTEFDNVWDNRASLSYS